MIGNKCRLDRHLGAMARPWEVTTKSGLLEPPQVVHQHTGPFTGPQPVSSPLSPRSPLSPTSPLDPTHDKMIKIVFLSPIRAGASVDVHGPPFAHFPPPRMQVLPRRPLYRPSGMPSPSQTTGIYLLWPSFPMKSGPDPTAGPGNPLSPFSRPVVQSPVCRIS
jgi:hypothetical protein